MMINKWTTERFLTNIKYTQKIGWIPKRIEEVDLNQSIIGYLLGY